MHSYISTSTKLLAVLFAIGLSCQQAPVKETLEELSPKEILIQRAKSFELPTSYTPPLGDPQHHHASGFAKILCFCGFHHRLGFGFCRREYRLF